MERVRFVVTARKAGHEVKVFLMGEAVECESMTHEKFDVAGQLKAFFDEGANFVMSKLTFAIQMEIDGEQYYLSQAEINKGTC